MPPPRVHDRDHGHDDDGGHGHGDDGGHGHGGGDGGDARHHAPRHTNDSFLSLVFLLMFLPTLLLHALLKLFEASDDNQSNQLT